MPSIQPREWIEFDSWGVFFGLKSSEMFWFNDAEDLVQFLCLDGDTYIKSLSTEKKAPIVAALQQQLEPSMNLLEGDGDKLWEVISEIQKCYDDRVPLRWYGQFSNLCSSDADFPQHLRSTFFKATGPLESTRKEDMSSEEFAQFLIGGW